MLFEPEEGAAWQPPTKKPLERNRENDLANELARVDLARTGPGTPGGRFMRRFWMAVCRSQDLTKRATKPIRIMSVDYALYRGESGRAHVIDYRCPHRGAQMHLGWVGGRRYPVYLPRLEYDCTGQCVEQPAEDSSFASKVKMDSYPTREYMGLIFAYLAKATRRSFRLADATNERASHRMCVHQEPAIIEGTCSERSTDRRWRQSLPRIRRKLRRVAFAKVSEDETHIFTSWITIHF